jgi:hypothetical protein
MDGKVGNKPLKTIDIDIAEIKEIICDVETFLYPTRGVQLFNGLSTEIKTRGNIDFPDNKRAEIIDKFQKSGSEILHRTISHKENIEKEILKPSELKEYLLSKLAIIEN